jgi:transposase
MISMPKIQSMRQLRRSGESIAAISRELEVSEPTVRKYLRKDDLSPRPPVRKSKASTLDRWVPVIEQWLAEDRETWHKQRHTATRIWQRLRDEHGATVSYSTVRRKVAELKREFACEREAGFMDLVWHPGEAQADFGQVEVSWRGAPARMHHFVLDFPYSNIGVSQVMPGENAAAHVPGPEGRLRLAGRGERADSVRQRRGRGQKAPWRRGAPGRPVRALPGALRVRVRVLQPVFGSREGRGRG